MKGVGEQEGNDHGDRAPYDQAHAIPVHSRGSHRGMVDPQDTQDAKGIPASRECIPGVVNGRLLGNRDLLRRCKGVDLLTDEIENGSPNQFRESRSLCLVSACLTRVPCPYARRNSGNVSVRQAETITRRHRPPLTRCHHPNLHRRPFGSTHRAPGSWPNPVR